jgi:hypothetical protein
LEIGKEGVEHMTTPDIDEKTKAVKSPTPDKKEIDLDQIRPDLAEVIERYSFGFDEQRLE